MSEIPFREPGRRTPAKGVHVSLSGPNWVFLTVCTEKRGQWLAQNSVQRTLHDIWQNTATAWLVSDYLLMPDHLHLFCAPYDLKFTIERWMGFWKDKLAKELKREGGAAASPYRDCPAQVGGASASLYQRSDLVGQSCCSAHSGDGTETSGPAGPPYQVGRFQSGGFHHRLRDGENYSQKWQYVRENPVRAGLVKRPEDWPYSGRVHEIRWSGD